MVRLEWVFLMQIVMGIVMIIFLQKLTQMKKQVDEIIGEVSSYISYVTEDMDAEILEETKTAQKDIIQEKNKKFSMGKEEKEEAQNRLIQAVLGEYFPQRNPKFDKYAQLCYNALGVINL